MEPERLDCTGLHAVVLSAVESVYGTVQVIGNNKLQNVVVPFLHCV